MNIDGNTVLIPHIGYPTHSFKAPMIYNPYFERQGINAVVVPFAVTADDFDAVVSATFRMKNVRGALVTMPHKIAACRLADEVRPAARIAGAANALRRDENGTLIADMFDGEGFVRGIVRKGFVIQGARALVIGAGGVGSAIAASLAQAGVGELALFDTQPSNALALAGRVRENFPHVKAHIGTTDPTGFNLVVNATPLGMNADDPLPLDVTKLHASMFVGEVVMKTEMTPLLLEAQARGCQFQIGTDMLFEMIPAYLEFFGFATASADELRATAKIAY